MIVFENGLETVKAADVLWHRPDAIRALGIMMMVDQAEGSTDMICDCPDDYKTKADIEAVFQNCAEMALDSLEDHIADLHRSLETFLRNAKVTAKVRRLDYNDQGGLSDITVDLDVA